MLLELSGLRKENKMASKAIRKISLAVLAIITLLILGRGIINLSLETKIFGIIPLATVFGIILAIITFIVVRKDWGMD